MVRSNMALCRERHPRRSAIKLRCLQERKKSKVNNGKKPQAEKSTLLRGCFSVFEDLYSCGSAARKEI